MACTKPFQCPARHGGQRLERQNSGRTPASGRAPRQEAEAEEAKQPAHIRCQDAEA